jgi:hypothetical protein
MARLLRAWYSDAGFGCVLLMTTGTGLLQYGYRSRDLDVPTVGIEAACLCARGCFFWLFGPVYVPILLGQGVQRASTWYRAQLPQLPEVPLVVAPPPKPIEQSPKLVEQPEEPWQAEPWQSVPGCYHDLDGYEVKTATK